MFTKQVSNPKSRDKEKIDTMNREELFRYTHVYCIYTNIFAIYKLYSQYENIIYLLAPGRIMMYFVDVNFFFFLFYCLTATWKLKLLIHFHHQHNSFHILFNHFDTYTTQYKQTIASTQHSFSVSHLNE